MALHPCPIDGRHRPYRRRGLPCDLGSGRPEISASLQSPPLDRATHSEGLCVVYQEPALADRLQQDLLRRRLHHRTIPLDANF